MADVFKFGSDLFKADILQFGRDFFYKVIQQLGLLVIHQISFSRIRVCSHGDAGAQSKKRTTPRKSGSRRSQLERKLKK